jgi:Carboxypeptidase regulatory-like domain
MTTLLSSILATALVAQLQGGTVQGRVVDDQGKPVANAELVFYAPPPLEGKVDPVEIRTKTVAGGHFLLESPPLGRTAMNGVHVWASRSGSALTAAPSYQPLLVLDLLKPHPRTVKVEGPDGQPVAGATISPRFLFVAESGATAELPDSLGRPLVVTTGPDGQATLNYLAARDKLVVVRLTAASIGTQDLQLLEVPARDAQSSPITIRLKPTGHLAGHIRNSAGEPIAGRTIELWSREGTWASPNLVEFKNGPLRSTADGAFRTPDSLFVGSQYRVAIRAPGMEPILSRWITVTQEPRVLLPFTLRPLRTVSGRVVDRQGKPLVGIEVFQSGDGPERTTTKSDQDGRFSLGGFRNGTVFLFARGQGFRFFGRLIKPSEETVTVELTRRSEKPDREMRKLPEPIPQEESRALARRLIEPCWNAAVTQKNETAGYLALRFLAAADPDRVLEKLEGQEFISPMMKSTIKSQVAEALARSDPARAQELAEALEKPLGHFQVLMRLADALPAQERERMLALLDRAALLATQANSQYLTAHVAERWYELGEKNKARALIEQSVRMGKENVLYRARYAARLARFDLPSALAIAKELPVANRSYAHLAYWNIALRLADEKPAEAERVLRMVPQEPGRYWIPPGVAWKMATADPQRARRLVDEALLHDDNPRLLLFLALGLKARDSAGANEAFWKAIDGIDRLMREGVEYAAMRGYQGIVLPVVEQTDPSLVPELFWRAIASRPPIGNPRTLFQELPINLTILLSFYDREVAAALYESVRAEIEQTDDGVLADWGNQFLAWSLFDPRAADARLEQVPLPSNLEQGNFARERVAEMLGLPYEERWRKIWSEHTEMRSILERDIR